MGRRSREMEPKITSAKKNIDVVMGLRTAKFERFMIFVVSV